jgi:hypothetical protein
MIIQLRRLGAVLIVAVLTAAGCGGSSSGGDNVSPPPPTTPPPSGGIIRSGVAAGPISDFGSVWVNGVRYNTDDATWTRDDNPSSQAEFKVGETVIVKGTIEEDNSNAIAQSVELDELVKGPATALVGLDTAIVMGQTVNSTLDTLIDDNCGEVSNTDLTGLTDFFAVEVYGSVRVGGAIDATRIECKTAADFADDEFEVNGIVDGLTATSFMINGLQVDFGATQSIDNFPGGQISDGDPVEVKGSDFSLSVTPSTDKLVAVRVEYKGNRFDGNEGDHYEIEGFISEFRGIDDFDVRVGSEIFTVITVPDNTVFEGDENVLDVNVKVEVEGDLDGDLNILATKVEIKTSTNIRVAGTVDTIVDGEIRVLNIRINTTAATRFDDKRDGDPNFDGSSLVAGDFIEARGQEIPAGEITAFDLELDDLDPDTELRGFVEPDSVVTDSAAAGYRESFRVLGVTIDTGSVEVYRDTNDLPISADEFWSVIEVEAAGGNGYLVDIKGTETGEAALSAQEVELEME